MKIISHRGNINGRDFDKENNPESIVQAINEGFDVEIDLWYTDKGLFLGHDSPQYNVELSWLIKNKDKLWVHSKNIDSTKILTQTDLNWFWHENDKFVLTSKGFMWCNFNVFIPNGVVVEFDYKKLPDFLFGVCTDKPLLYK